ncbi:MAG: hypothetical protein K5765_03760 [Clostridia bacterium]|nr:hypothetical protein [Clostridia bacterium]
MKQLLTKKKIKIAFKDFWPGFNIKQLGKAFNNNPYLFENNIELVISDDPDICFFGTFGNFIFDACNTDPKIIKVLFISEVLSPDFLFFDYCFCFEPYNFNGRNCFYPEFVYSMEYFGTALSQKTFAQCKEIIKEKTIFCEMIYNHDGIDVSRKKYFDLLNSYKKVESAGTFLNNQPNNETVSCLNGNKSKINYQNKCKFSICIQSIKKDWFINEKIVHSLYANEIPIVYATEDIKKIFNPKRFIFIEDYDTDEELLNRIVKIDNDDRLFCEIISEPPFLENNFVKDTLDNACIFVYELANGKKGKRLIEINREELIKNRIIESETSANKFKSIKSNIFVRLLLRIKTHKRKQVK